MADPATEEEWTEKFYKNYMVEGYGTDMAVHTPCPFCAAKDFMVVHPAAGILPGDDRLNLYEEFDMNHTCEECGRSARQIVNRGENGVLETELVQTDGPDPPVYVRPWPRRYSGEVDDD